MDALLVAPSNGDQVARSIENISIAKNGLINCMLWIITIIFVALLLYFSKLMLIWDTSYETPFAVEKCFWTVFYIM